ncbi:hypothetical protein [Streptomyces sp. PvR034]|uniref:hypothetical protein n=1 Tax=Streptomyces sp. PvR034 TaxID=3156401 RepID=UPI0033916FD7
MQSVPSEPALPDPVPTNRDAVTPDLPPSGPGAPDLPDADRRRAGGAGGEKDDTDADRSEEKESAGERPAAGPGNAKPQEPTD